MPFLNQNFCYYQGPMFHTVPLSDRLSKDDAKFVDVIHSGGLWIGTDEPVSLQENTPPTFWQII